MDTSHTDRPMISAGFTPIQRPTLTDLTGYTARHAQSHGATLTLKLHTPTPNSDQAPQVMSFTLSLVDLTTTPPRWVTYTSTDGGRTIHYTGSLYHMEHDTTERPACLEPYELLYITDETGRTSRTITEAAQTTKP